MKNWSEKIQMIVFNVSFYEADYGEVETSLHFLIQAKSRVHIKEIMIMKLKRNYLTSSELMDIVKELVQHDNVVEREIIKIAMLVQILTDCEKKETANDYYDEYVKQKDIDFEVDVCNAYTVDKLVDKELSVDHLLKALMENLSKQLDGFNLNESIDKLKGVMDNGNK